MIKEKFIRTIRNYSLRAKITLIVFITVILMTVISVIGIIITMNSSNSLLYQSLAGSLEYTANDISGKLASIESMTNTILTNTDVRKNMIALLDADTEIQKKNASNNLERLLTEYYQTYKNNNIRYISLYSNDTCITSYKPAASQTPEHIHTNIIAETKSNSGYPIWDTSHCNTHGLFLGREARHIDNLSFRTLGTLVVCIDMNKMVSSSTKSILYSDNIKYILSNEDSVFFRSNDFTQKEASHFSDMLTSDYQVINDGTDTYFALRGTIASNSWNYICLIPYNKIAKTIHTTEFIVFLLILCTIILVLFLAQQIINITVEEFSHLVNKMILFSKDDSIAFEEDSTYKDRKDEIGVLHNQFDQMVLKIQNLIKNNYIKEILTKEAQIKALENQINPHFLYNTLESVNWRAKAIGESDISAMVESLGKLLRETLSKQGKINSLRHELQIVSNYITIQKIRYGERLDYTENVQEEFMDIQLPHLTLQPLVENAIYYGLEEIIEPCHIEISARKNKDYYIISIQNNGSQFEPKILEKILSGERDAHGFGIGLINIEKRLRLIYDTKRGLELYNLDEDTAVVNIYIPGGSHDKNLNCR